VLGDEVTLAWAINNAREMALLNRKTVTAR
jgi:hypothetical protein